MSRFSQAEIVRYSRQMLLPGVGGAGQAKLRDAKVLIVGAGGLGSPAALYLAAAGVGRIGLADSDRVDLSNLQRQILHRSADLGRPKAESGRETLLALNPGIEVTAHVGRLTPANALDIIGQYDVVIDGVDNFGSRYLLNDCCRLAGIPLVEGSVLRFDGMLFTILPATGPCYRCVFPEPPPPGVVPTCREAGVLGPVPGVIGCLQALETLKLILGIGRVLSGRILFYDGLNADFREAPARRASACLCQTLASLADRPEYQAQEACPTEEDSEGRC
ncbi:MAG: HesA/MoeB/ThiF family protein [Bacillota bacterium]